MHNSIQRMIHAFDGHAYTVAGFLMGFFDDPRQTRQCASQIADLIHREVEVFGNQLRMTL